MKNKMYLCTFVLFLCTALSVQAQRTLSGRVLGPDSVALKDATVLLYLANDSLPLRVATTDKRGEYTFQADTARYVMQVSLMGYAPYERKFIFSSQSKTVRLDDVILREAVRQIGEVEIQGEQDQTTVKLEDDKEVYTLSSRVKRNAASAYMALADVPGLEVDLIHDNVSVRGSDGGTQIMVNNIRRSRGYVQTIDPKTIDRVEVIRFPSMRYSSQGIGGLVNIVTKEPVRGHSGNVSLSQDPLLRYGSQYANFTRVRDKWAYSLYANNFYFDEDEHESYILRKTRREGGFWDTVEKKTYGEGLFNMVSPNVGFSMDFIHSPRSFTSLSARYGYSSMSGSNLYKMKETTSWGSRAYFGAQQNENKNQNAGANFYHQTQWNNIHTLSVDGNYWWYAHDGNSDYREMEMEGGVPFYRTDQKTDNVNMGAEVQANMEHKWEKVTLGEGYRFSWKQYDQDKRINETYDHLLYDEWQNNLYVDLSGKFHPKWFYRVGANLDIIKTKILGRSNVYADVIPSATLRFNMARTQFVSLSYKRSRKMPGLSMLNPMSVTVDSVRVYQGNPDLLPTYTNTVTFGFYSYVKKLYVYLTLGYNWGNSFSSVSKVNDKGVNVITYGRASERRSPSAMLDIAWFMTKWLKLGVVSTVSYSMYKDSNEEQFNKNLWSTSVRPYGTITAKRLYATLSFPITIKQKNFTGYTKSVRESSVSMSYRLNNSWNLMLDCRYFEPLRYWGETDIDGFYEYYRNKDGRYFRMMLGARYYFRKGKTVSNKGRKKVQYDSSAESEVKAY